MATSNWFYLGAGAAGGAGAAVAAYHMFSHVRRRVQAWRDPWSDVDDIGYQAAQSLFAIGTGGWFGMGLYQGMPEKIPVVDKDTATRLGSRKLGEMTELVSQFEIENNYTQINYNGVPYRVTPLSYADPIKWLYNQKKGLPAYITVNMVTQQTDLVCWKME